MIAYKILDQYEYGLIVQNFDNPACVESHAVRLKEL